MSQNHSQEVTEPCIGYCDPTGVGKHPHPEWPADKICDECLLGTWEEWIQNQIAIAYEAIGETEANQIIREFIE